MALTELPPVALHAEVRPAALTPLPIPQESVYLQFLPIVYRQDPFLRRFLLIFDSVLAPIERMVDSLALYTEPEMAPAEFMPWLAHWVAASLDARWPLDRQRALIDHAIEIYRWRGTSRGLKLHVQVYTGIAPIIQEYREGFVLGREGGLGWTTHLAPTPANPVSFTVTVPVERSARVDLAVLRQIIEEDKPAHTTYRLRVVPSDASPGPGPSIAHPR